MSQNLTYFDLKKSFTIRAIVLASTIVLATLLLVIVTSVTGSLDWWLIIVIFSLYGWPTLEFIFRVFMARVHQEMEDEKSGNPRQRYFVATARKSFLGNLVIDVRETDEPLWRRGVRAMISILISLIAMVVSPITSLFYLMYLVIKIVSFKKSIKRIQKEVDEERNAI